MKKCSRCKIIKNINKFYFNKSQKDGKDNQCKKCKKEYRIKHSETNKIKQKENHKNNPLKRIYYDAKKRAKKKNIEFNIKLEDLNFPKLCPVLQIPLFVSGSKCTNNSPTIDRINNNEGYIKDNVLIVSFKANTIKNNSTIEELEKILNFYKQYVR